MSERVVRLVRCRRGHLAWVVARDGSRRCGACHARRMRGYRKATKRKQREMKRMGRRIAAACVPQRLDEVRAQIAFAQTMDEPWPTKQGA